MDMLTEQVARARCRDMLLDAATERLVRRARRLRRADRLAARARRLAESVGGWYDTRTPVIRPGTVTDQRRQPARPRPAPL